MGASRSKWGEGASSGSNRNKTHVCGGLAFAARQGAGAARRARVCWPCSARHHTPNSESGPGDAHGCGALKSERFD